MFGLPMGTGPDRMRALAFDLTVSRASAKARGVVTERVLSEAKSAEHGQLLLARMGLEL